MSKGKHVNFSKLLAPLVTEKTATQADTLNQYSFKVMPSMTKKEIANTVASYFEVTVENVSIINYKGKIKKFGQKVGKRAAWKKAIVKLKSGDTLNFVESGGAV
ncbi:MAG: 50S ribosomal protein L23 [Bdellovibrionota bacterium]|nr:50S ribosomal protein L23 [Bdellovibrionota bacterium]